MPLDSTRFWICVFGHFEQMHCPKKNNKAICSRYICIIPRLLFFMSFHSHLSNLTVYPPRVTLYFVTLHCHDNCRYCAKGLVCHKCQGDAYYSCVQCKYHSLLFNVLPSTCSRVLSAIYIITYWAKTAMIYEDGKIECEKWQATVTAPLHTATIPGTIQTLINPCQPPSQSSSNGGLPLKTFNFLGPRISWHRWNEYNNMNKYMMKDLHEPCGPIMYCNARKSSAGGIGQRPLGYTYLHDIWHGLSGGVP